VNCLEFRRLVGAEPHSTDPRVAAHRAGCPACARHQDDLQAMDVLLGKALRLDPSRLAAARPGVRAGAARGRRWLALAASLVAGVLVAATLWVSYPAPTLAAEVIGHALHEPQSWLADQPLPSATVAEVLQANGVRLRAGVATVTYARRCFFDRHWVPHLVVQTPAGPVTVFLLAHREVGAPTRIEERGLSAVVLPAPHGSIAVVGRDVPDLDAVARKLYESVEWQA
jgi:hypothetical protein